MPGRAVADRTHVWREVWARRGNPLHWGAFIPQGKKYACKRECVSFRLVGMSFHLRTFASGSPDVPEPKQGTGVVHPTGPGVPRLSSRAIFAGVTEVEIEHNGVLYRLRQTSLGKLILTK